VPHTNSIDLCRFSHTPLTAITAFNTCNLLCSFALNVRPFMTDIFPEQLATD